MQAVSMIGGRTEVLSANTLRPKINKSRECSEKSLCFKTLLLPVLC